MTLSQILSQEKATEHLRNMLITGRIPPALLFCGPGGCGKFPAALAFAAALDCTRIPHIGKRPKPAPRPPADDLFSVLAAPASEEALSEELSAEKLDIPVGESCGKCLSCLQIEKGVHPDITITGVSEQAEKTGKETANLKVDTMRDMLKKVYQRALISPYKVFIVRDAEKLMPEAQNAILKTLEDPPEGTVLILLCSDRNALLPTILSRAAEVDFKPLSHEAMKILLEKEGISGKESDFLAKAGQGSLDKARYIKLFTERASKLVEGDKTNIFRFVSMLSRDSHKAREETNYMLDLMIYRQREIWKNSPESQEKLAQLIKSTMELRAMTNRNVSSSRILTAALLASQTAGISIEDILFVRN